MTLVTWLSAGMTFNCIVDEHLSLKQKRVKRKVPRWFNNEITQAIKARDRLLKVAKKSDLSTEVKTK